MLQDIIIIGMIFSKMVTTVHHFQNEKERSGRD